MALYRKLTPSLTGGELAPALHSRVDTAKFQSGVALAENVFIHPQGGISNRVGLEFVCELLDSGKPARLVDFQFSLDQTYIMELGNQGMSIVREGGRIITQNAIYDVTGISQAQPCVVSCPGHTFNNGDLVFLFNADGMPEIDQRAFTVTNKAADSVQIVDMWGNAVNSSAYAKLTSSARLGKIYQRATPYNSDQVSRVQWEQEADVLYMVHEDHPIQKFIRMAEDNWDRIEPDFQPKMTPPTGVEAERESGSGAEEYRYKVSAISEETGEESLPSTEAMVTNDLLIAGKKNRVSWEAKAEASRYLIYKNDAGVYGYIGGTDGTYFIDENITADLADTPQKAANPFDEPGKYPRCVKFYEQRLFFASTKKEPRAIWASQSGANYENFGSSIPSKATDSFTQRVPGRQLNQIHSLAAHRQLLLMTSGVVSSISGADDKGFLTPSNPRIQPELDYGVAPIEPLLIGKTLLLVGALSADIISTSYDFTDDGYGETDLTVLAEHLFRDRSVKSWAYAHKPHRIVWAVMDDGSLLSMTYHNEHEVWGWTRHKTKGYFEDVRVIPEGNNHITYFVVRREINGHTKRYIERLRARDFNFVEEAFFVDCGRTYRGDPASVIYGLEHLEGETLVALADGHVAKNLSVIDGRIELPFAAAVVHVGLPYTARLETLPLDLGNVPEIGTVQGRKKTVPSVTINTERSRGFWFGNNFEKMTEYKQRSTEGYGEPIALHTGTITQTLAPYWDKQGAVCIEQRDPLPMTILSIAPDVVLGG